MRARPRCAIPRAFIALKTRACAALAEAVVSTTHPWSYFADGERAAFERVAKSARMSRFGGDCYAYAMLASGHIDIIIEAELKHWDVAALIPVIENAGGIVTDWEGKPGSRRRPDRCRGRRARACRGACDAERGLTRFRLRLWRSPSRTLRFQPRMRA